MKHFQSHRMKQFIPLRLLNSYGTENEPWNKITAPEATALHEIVQTEKQINVMNETLFESSPY